MAESKEKEDIFEEDLEFDDFDFDEDVKEEEEAKPEDSKAKIDLDSIDEIANKQGALIAENILMKKMMENPDLAKALEQEVKADIPKNGSVPRAQGELSEDDKVAYLEEKLKELEQKQELREQEERWRFLENEAEKLISTSPLFSGFEPKIRDQLKEEFLLNYASSGATTSIDSAFKKFSKDFNEIRKAIITHYVQKKREKANMPISPAQAFASLKEEENVEEFDGDALSTGKVKEIAKKYLEKLRKRR